VAYTVAAAMGAGVVAFQAPGVRDIWAGGVGAINWMVPIFSFSLLCALALDYDIFIMTRVVEYKQLGFTDRAAIIKAVWRTGRIISFAGLVMFFAFGAMMLSNVVMLNQFGFIAATSVLVDTFVIRPLFVPALMAVVPGRGVWWPRRFEKEHLQLDVMDMTEWRE
jgi:uncharacterized membrane protein YdfJ with MMPL/SSD domain